MQLIQRSACFLIISSLSLQLKTLSLLTEFGLVGLCQAITGCFISPFVCSVSCVFLSLSLLTDYFDIASLLHCSFSLLPQEKFLYHTQRCFPSAFFIFATINLSGGTAFCSISPNMDQKPIYLMLQRPVGLKYILLSPT